MQDTCNATRSHGRVVDSALFSAVVGYVRSWMVVAILTLEAADTPSSGDGLAYPGFIATRRPPDRRLREQATMKERQS